MQIAGASTQSQRRRFALLVIAGLVALAAVGAYNLSRARCFALTGPVICRVETTRPQVALTFDDGPTAAGVDAILPILERHQAKATFFLIGSEMALHPTLAPRIARAGHEVANHSYSHQRMIGHPGSFYRDEIVGTETLLRQAAGESTGFFRPPYGKKLIGLPLAVRDQKLRMVLWDVEDPLDAPDARSFADRVVSEARPGSIILVHAMYRHQDRARDALPLILAGLTAKGLQVVTVGELLRNGEAPP